ncbi:MAG: SEC-C metal-binding domain-containing protein [Patescibacteria group bacterium]
MKIGRNDPCQCGSGKKYKKCCMDKKQKIFISQNKSVVKKPKHESYIVGQEYIDDEDKIEVLIKYTIILPSIVDNFNIDDYPLHVVQNGNKIYVNFNKIISKKLLEDIKKHFCDFKNNNYISKELTKKNPSQFIVGYISETLPRINKEILNRKYNEGHIIVKTISQFDISEVFVVDDLGGIYAVLWPLSVPGFPPSNDDGNYNVTYIKDLIDAMTEYFYYNPDECIRKIITSLENYFIYYNLKSNNKLSKFNIFKKNIKFRRLVDKYIREEYYSYKEENLKILRNNILYFYHIRNLIVHDKLRLNLENLMFCKKAIGTLFYIYQSSFISNDGKFNYIFSFDMQFKLIVDRMLGVNLDRLKKIKDSKRKHSIIDNKDGLDKIIFNNLKITKKDKRRALKI